MINTLDKSTAAEIQDDYHGLVTHIDNYLQWSPAISLYAFDLAHFHTFHSAGEQTILHISSQLMVMALVIPAKKLFHRERPDLSSDNSFPSGHTATAFASAEIFHQELNHNYPLLSYFGYIPAAITGMLRIYNNKHYISDVVAGAGLGIISAKVSYWAFEKFWKPHKHFRTN